MDPATEIARNAAPDGSLVLEIERRFDAPRALVFEMWTKGERMRQWAAPEGFTITAGEGDAHLGASWRSAMRGPDGKELWLSGVYREITPPERLVFTHQWDGGPETLVTVTFEEVDGLTRMRFRQTGFGSASNRDGHGGGWEQSFNKLEQFVQEFVEKDARRAPADDRQPLVLEIERLFEAPRELVFRVWSSPEHIVRWWGPKGFHLGHCEMDFRVGGRWRFCMQPEGGQQHWIHGVYREIAPPERLSFTYVNDADGHDMVVTMDFIDVAGNTLLKFHQAKFMSVAERDGHRGGWSQTFEILQRYLLLLQAGMLSDTPLGWRQNGVEADLQAAIDRHKREAGRPEAKDRVG